MLIDFGTDSMRTGASRRKGGGRGMWLMRWSGVGDDIGEDCDGIFSRYIYGFFCFAFERSKRYFF
jgi:hypothetical protein